MGVGVPKGMKQSITESSLENDSVDGANCDDILIMGETGPIGYLQCG
jgi:hypothetical protein